MYNVVDSAFNDAMTREGQQLSLFIGLAQFTAFFRRNADNLSTRDTMIMYYGKDAPVKSGSLISLYNDVYITLNHEHQEGTTYYKSALEKCNGRLTTNNLSVIGLPFFGDNLKSGLSVDGTHLSLIDGNMEIITQDCESSRALRVDDTFNEFGRTWKIENIFFVDGIAHILIQITVDEVINYEYTLELSDIGTMNAVPGDVLNLYVTAYVNGVEDTNANIKLQSSDTKVATITDDGNINFIAPGEVTFSAIWVDHNIIKYTDKITCVAVDDFEDLDAVALYVEDVKELYCDFDNEPIKYYVTIGGQRVSGIPITFKAEYPASAVLERNISVEVSEDSVLVNPADSRLLGKSFTLTAKNEEYNLRKQLTIKVVSVW